MKPSQLANVSRVRLHQVVVCVLMLVGALFSPEAILAKEKTWPITYQTHIRTIFRDHCESCHNGRRSRAGLDLSSFGGLMQGSSAGSVVAKGDASESLVYLTMAHLEEPAMPPGNKKVPAEKVEIVRKWIDSGLPEKLTDVKQVSSNTVSKEMAAESTPTGVASTKKDTLLAKATLNLSPVLKGLRPAPVAAIDVSPDGKLAVVGQLYQILVYRLGTENKLVGVLPFPEGEVAHLEFSNDGKRLLAAGGRPADSGSAVIWETATGRRIGVYGDEFDVAMAADFSEDGNYVVLGGADKIGKRLDARTGANASEIEKHTDWLLDVSFSPADFIFATADRAGNVFIWETESGNELHTLRGHTKAVHAVAWNHSGDQCLTACEDGQLRIWDMRSGKLLKSWKAHDTGILDMSTHDQNAIYTVGRDFAVKKWSLNGKLVNSLKLESLPLQVAAIDQRSALVGLKSGDAVVVNLETAEKTASLSPPDNLVTADLAKIDLKVDSPVMATVESPPNEIPTPRTIETPFAEKFARILASQQKIDQLATDLKPILEQMQSASLAVSKQEAKVEELKDKLARIRKETLNSTSKSTNPLDQAVVRALNTRDEVARLASLVDHLSRAQKIADQLEGVGTETKESIVLIRLAHEKAFKALEQARSVNQKSDNQLAKLDSTAKSRSTATPTNAIAEELNQAEKRLKQLYDEWDAARTRFVETRTAYQKANSAFLQASDPNETTLIPPETSMNVSE